MGLGADAPPNMELGIDAFLTQHGFLENHDPSLLIITHQDPL
jgi:hypothetical protein